MAGEITGYNDFEKTRKIFADELNDKLDAMVERALELPVSYTSNAPQVYLGEATKCFIHGFFGASIALSRATLEQLLRDKLGVSEDEAVDLRCLIKIAAAKGLLDNNLEGKATSVRKWGNRYIHDTKKKDLKYTERKKRSKDVLLAVKMIIETLYPR